jgi:U3 small nucleolar RNA-associated protein 4
MVSIPVNPTTPAAGITTALHRVRFVDYHPSPITSLAFTPVPFPSPDPAAVHQHGRGQGNVAVRNEMGALVCARQNGEVQIWEWAEGEKEDKEDEVTGSWVLRRVSDTWSSGVVATRNSAH